MMFDVRGFFRSCSRCGSCGRVDLYCEYCWRFRLRPQMLKGPSLCFSPGGESFKGYALFRWGLESESVGAMIHALKGRAHERAFARLALLFSHERSALEKMGPAVVVPSPPKRAGTRDHGYLWAKALADYWGAPLLPLLARDSEDEQKGKSAAERKSKRLKLLKNGHGALPAGVKVIFADDVYTTGATARAAHEALGRPADFEVWVVACRPKLFLI